jgi:hypothetical protein
MRADELHIGDLPPEIERDNQAVAAACDLEANTSVLKATTRMQLHNMFAFREQGLRQQGCPQPTGKFI